MRRFTISATGNVLPGQAHACSLVSSAADDSTLQTILYGGCALGQRVCDDVFVLSMPSFPWVKIEDHGKQDKNLTDQPVGRYQHICELYGDQEMLVLEGHLMFGTEIQNKIPVNLMLPFAF